jgi:hypothetical protein
MNLPGAPPACVRGVYFTGRIGYNLITPFCFQKKSKWDPCGWPSQVLGLGLFSLRLLPVITAWAQSSFEVPHTGVLPYTFKPLMNHHHHHHHTECTTFCRVFQSWQDRTNTPQKQLTGPMPGRRRRGMGFVCMSWKDCLKSFLWEIFVGMWWGSQMIYREGVYTCLVIDCRLNFLESLGRISDIWSNGVSKRRR